MELKKIIIHELIKNRGENETELILSDELININDNAIGLVSTLNKSFNTDRIFHAIFDQSEGKYFPEKFTEYLQSNRDNDDFITYTRNVISNLDDQVKKINFATGGYFAFCEYKINGYDFNSVFLIRDIEGKTLERTEHSFTIESIEYVDTNNLAMACRINENRLEEDEINYLTLTQLKQQEISDYFKDWICIEQLQSSKEYTKELYNIISQIERPQNPETDEEYEIETFRNLVYGYISTNPNKSVNIRDLSQHFYNDPNTISEYAHENDITIDTEFRYNNRELKKFIKVEINRDGINLKFSRGAFNDKIRLSDEADDIVIIESDAFARALRKEIAENNENENLEN
ncbi:nucleoid-associated protein [Gillisia sp. CAL575]|uniref:nucleoid-associated protein n=1 Tax=Gillisia sp. CAL575 TaxID=985255 RepID=UPI0003A5333C|nr:nucleoid-associated protein [Gillisia sp. CAL575]